MKDEAIYRCIHAACARALPRPVNFCPFCGTGQHAGVDKPAHRMAGAGVATPSSAIPAAAQVNIAKPAAVPASSAPASAVPANEEGRHAPMAPVQPPAGLPHPPAVPSPAQGSSGSAGHPGPGAAQPRPAAAPRAAPGPARPPERQPIRLRWWLLALAALWAIWLLAKPGDKKIEARIDKAVALAIACKASEAQSELIALRSTRASPQQLARLQQELNDAAAECKRARERSRAWSAASAAVETALGSSSYDKARSRLSAFTRRWGEDEETRALKAKVDAAAPREHPLASPSGR